MRIVSRPPTISITLLENSRYLIVSTDSKTILSCANKYRTVATVQQALDNANIANYVIDTKYQEYELQDETE